MVVFTKNEVSPPHLGLPELKVLGKETVQVLQRFQVHGLRQPLRFQGDTQSSHSLYYFFLYPGKVGIVPPLTT